MKIVYYVNQFFGGIGAEEHAGAPLEFRDGALGPAKLFEQLMGDGAAVTLTIVCGDNYAVEHQDEVTAAVLEKIRAIGRGSVCRRPLLRCRALRHGRRGDLHGDAIGVGHSGDNSDAYGESRRRSVPRSAPHRRLGIAPVLSFSIEPSATPAGGSISAGTLDFGILEVNTPKTAEHVLTVTTNAPGGYSVTGAEATPLTSGTDKILDTTGDDSSITESATGPWSLNTTTGFGFSLQNYAGSDAAFIGGFRQFADVSAAEAPKQVMGNAGPVTASSVGLAYKVNVGPTQKPGLYTSTLTYVCTGNF